MSLPKAQTQFSISLPVDRGQFILAMLSVFPLEIRHKALPAQCELQKSSKILF